MPAQVDVHGRVPFLDGGRDEHPVAHDPGIVDHHVEVAERVDGGLHDASGSVPVGDVLVVGDRLAARRDDFRHHAVGGAGVAPFAAQRGADIVDHDIRALGSEGERIGPPQPARGAGDDDGSVFADSHG